MTGTAADSGGMDAAVFSDVSAWREKALNATLVVSSLAGLPSAVLVTIPVVSGTESSLPRIIHLTLYLSIVCLTIWRRPGTRCRAWALMLLGYLTGCLAMAFGGLAGDGRIYLLALPVAAWALIGMRAGVGTAVLALLTYLGFSIAENTQWLGARLATLKSPQSWGSWLAGGLVLAFCMAGLLALQGGLVRALEAAAETRDRLRLESEEVRRFNETIVQCLNDGVVLEDANGRVRFANRAARKLFGYAPGEMIGVHWRDLVAGEATALVAEESAKRAGGVASRYESSLLTKDGKRVPAIVSARPLFVDKEYTGVLAVVTDLRDLRRMEQRVRRSEERLRAVVQNMPVMLDALDADNTIIAWNKECERVTGYGAGEMIGNPGALEKLYPDPDRLRRILSEWSERGDFRDWEIELTAEDGNAKTISWSNISGEFAIPGWAAWAVGVDVTARKQAEREAARTERLAAMGGLAAALAHEINSPLQAIRSNLELTTGFELPEDERIERLNVVRREVERLIEVSRSTLDLARPDQETRSPVSVEALVKRSVDVMQEELRRARVVVTSEYPEPVPRVLVAPARIMQVLVNVLVNAAEAMPDGGRVHVTAGVRAQTVALVFSNQGRPLSEEQTKRVFEPFYTTKQGGSGLGLFMSRAIVEWHGGRMSIQNLANGTGVALTVELPAAERARWKEGTA